MAQQHDSNDAGPAAAATTTTSGLSLAAHGGGMLLLLAATAASGAMVFQHMVGLSLPGCGPASACARAANSVWGTLPVIDWPVSHVGLAYFLGLLLAWILSRGGVTATLKNTVRLGAAGSVLFVVVMIVHMKEYLCQYCITVHTANLLFWLLVEGFSRPSAVPSRAVAALGAMFIVSTVGLAAGELATRQQVAEREEGERAESSGQIIEQSGGAANPEGAGFTGRYRLGPEDAPIRMVIFMDYQCEDCGRIEKDIFEIFDERDDMSISVKQFPFCTDCNKYMPRNDHPNACWASRAAEAAGILRGNDGFWKMHHWLFSVGGGFTNEELEEFLVAEGYDLDLWARTMAGPETLRLVQQDIDEGIDLGIRYTPMIFINGVELKGWRVQDAVRRTVEEVAATNPPARTAAHDRPLTALDAAVEAWRTATRFPVPPDVQPWPMGAEDAPIQIVLWGDYQEPFSAEADGLVRQFMAGRSDVRYDFRHYPMNQECNPNAASTKHPYACVAAKAAEAAGILGGREAYARMHEWLMAHQSDFTEEFLDLTAEQMGLDLEAFRAAMAGDRAAQAIEADATFAKRIGLRSIPFIFVNGKFVEAWRNQRGEFLSSILAAAAESVAAPPPPVPAGTE